MISTGQAIRTIRARKINSSYILFGGEPFLEDCFLTELYNSHKNENISKIHYSMDQDNFSDLLMELLSNSLFKDKRIIVVREIKKIRSEKNRTDIIEYMKSPNLNVILVVISEEYDIKNVFLNKISKVSEAIDTRTPFENEMKKWILFHLKKENIKITNNALEQYIELYGDYISHVINEIKNSSLNIGQDKVINKDISSNLGGYNRLFPLWNIQDCLGKKDIKLSLEILNSLLINGTKVTVIIINLVNLYQQILWRKMGKIKLEGYTGLNKVISSRINLYNKNFTFNELFEILQELRKIDLLSKTTSINHQLLLEKLFIKICGNIYA